MALLMELLEEFLVLFPLFGRQLIADVLKGFLHGLADLALTFFDKLLNGIMLLRGQFEGGIHFLHQRGPMAVKIRRMRGGDVDRFRRVTGSGDRGGSGMSGGDGAMMQGRKKIALRNINKQTTG